MSGLLVLCITLGIFSYVFQASANDFLCRKTVDAVCNLQPDPNRPASAITGTIRFRQTAPCYHGQGRFLVRIQGKFTGLPPSENGGRKHGFHIHTNGDLSDGCRSMGSHYNPFHTIHGRLGDVEKCRHVGDLGNIIADASGNAIIDFLAPPPVSLYGALSIIDRGIVLHADEDDFGRGGNPGSETSGNAGARIACCIIERVRN